MSEWTLNPLWVRLDQSRTTIRYRAAALVSRGRSLSIGSFLGPDEKASFAKLYWRRCRPQARPGLNRIS